MNGSDRRGLVGGLRHYWRMRPGQYRRGVWLLMLGFDALPWPLGEEIFARLFVAKAFVQPRRLRSALEWAGSRGLRGWRRWRLALTCCANHGRFVARSALLGLRSPAQYRPNVVVRGAEHIAGGEKGLILLNFHLGPPASAAALRAAGYDLTWLGGQRGSPAWSRESWRPLQDGLSVSIAKPGWGGVLYQALRLLRQGGIVMVNADGTKGRMAFRVLLTGTLHTLRSGWLALHQRSGAPVVPIFTHLEARTQVVTVHPPLPPVPSGDDTALEECRKILRRLLEEYVQRYPDQCYSMAFYPKLSHG